MRYLARAVLVGLLSLSLAGSAFAQTGGDLTSTSVLPPDSPLFFIQRLLDTWEEFLAFEEIDEARVQAKIARNRLAETTAMLKARKAELAAALSSESAERVEKAGAELVKAKAKADEAKRKAAEAKDKGEAERARGAEAEASARQEAIDRVLARLVENDKKRQEALEGALENVENERAREAIQTAMERSKRGLKTAAERVGKDAPGKPDSTGRPEIAPTRTGVPTDRPEGAPTGRPGVTPTRAPANAPTARPATAPTGAPGGRP